MIETLNTINLPQILFYVFSGIMVLAAVATISCKNPVHSVLCLILAFFNGAALFILQGAELVGLLLVVVYVGAVAVLFLFVVMMLNAKPENIQKGRAVTKYLAVFIITVVGFEIWLLVSSWQPYPEALVTYLTDPSEDGEMIELGSNAAEIGSVLYTTYFYLFQMAGLILLVAMIGAIVLTLRTRTGLRQQQVAEQIKRTKENSIHYTNPGIGEGV